MSTYFINGRPNVTKKIEKSSSWLAIFLTVLYDQTALFLKELITFIISVISLFVRVIPEALLDANFLYQSYSFLIKHNILLVFQHILVLHFLFMSDPFLPFFNASALVKNIVV